MTKFNSLMQGGDECYVCHKTGELHTHEIFFGKSNRKKSIKWKCQVKLCPQHHNMSNDGVHFNKELDMSLKRECQKRFELLYGREVFMNEFHKNYL